MNQKNDQITWIILNAVKHLQVGKIKLAQFLKGSKSKDIISISDKIGYGGILWHDIPTIQSFIEQLEQMELIRKNNHSGGIDYSTYELTEAGKIVLEGKKQITLQAVKKIKPITIGDSERETLNLMNGGKTVHEIAEERGLVKSTVYTHCFRLITHGYVSSRQVVSEDVINNILGAINNKKEIPSVKEIKELLPDVSYEEIRCVLADMKRGKQNGLD